MIKAAIFDYGGVVTAGGGVNNELQERLAENLGITVHQAENLLNLVWKDYMLGKLREDQLWQRLETEYGKPISKEKRHIWNTWEHMQARPEVAEIINNLKANGIKVGLLSNVIPNTASEIREHGGYKLFDFMVLSFEVGAVKPDLSIYHQASAYVPAIAADSIVYLDDQERCLLPARSLGWHTILVTSGFQLRNDLKRLLKNENGLEL